VKPEGGTADASRKFAAGLANGSNGQRKLEVAAAEAQAGSCNSGRRKPEVV